MGTHGRSGVKRLLLGSVTEKVLRRAPCPVLTMPPGLTSARLGLTFGRILCAVDFSTTSIRALEYAASLAAAAGPGVHALNVVELLSGTSATRDAAVLDTPDFRAGLLRTARERLHAVIPDRLREMCPIEESATIGTAWKEILRIAHEERADLIALGVRGRSAAEVLLFGSTAQHVVRQAECPVLTIRADS
jgi:nucleotide-binding universal stress UspA family protein